MDSMNTRKRSAPFRKTLPLTVLAGLVALLAAAGCGSRAPAAPATDRALPIGGLPGVSSVQTGEYRIGLGDTLRMALTGNGERVSAETALRLGLVTEVVWPQRPT